MKPYLSFVLALFTLLPSAYATEKSIKDVAYDAAIWGTPTVAFHAMREAYLQDAGAQYNDVVYFSKPADWQFQITTPNSSSYYSIINFNTKKGPVVLDLPKKDKVAGLFATVNDAWQMPLVDAVPGKYLILPPNYKGKIPKGYTPVRSATYNGYAAIRVNPLSETPPDIKKAMSLIQSIKAYEYSLAKNPPVQKYIDIAGVRYDAIVKYDETFFHRLSAMINEEPVLKRNQKMMAELKKIGILKGKSFITKKGEGVALAEGAQDARKHLMERMSQIDSYWPDSRWGFGKYLAGLKSHNTDDLAVIFFIACAPAKNVGEASMYLGSFLDKSGEVYDGGKTYHLRVPARVPAKEFWSVTAYDAETAGFIRNTARQTIDSYNEEVLKNEDGSVDIYFSPKAPPGPESNWIVTTPGKKWFTFFRLYGPEQAIVDKTWRLNDIEEVGKVRQAQEEK